MKTTVLLTLLVGVVHLASGTVYHCPGCPTECPPLDPASCPHGIVTDTCDCCNVCGKGPGEICSDAEWKCGKGLYCLGDRRFPCCYGYCVRN
ncbi:single insulin-like growth factor-binding domain protein-2 [Penaeus chinensis]|uniref:single insulin-like growth factor-binding domain protein-2 n=1 Tax=Penaeus chinensis TaxID=139456 RepID=UPI001FB58628|nr:single insulin-like growth factor-binding domain protein-2 [Penaeus chinensis]